MKQVIDLSDEKYEKDLNNLQKFSSEIDTKQIILAIMIDMGMAGHESYNKYFEELLSEKIQYEKDKNSFIQQYINPLVKGKIIYWNISFTDKKIELNVEN